MITIKNESRGLDKIDKVIPNNVAKYELSNDYTGMSFDDKSKLMKEIGRYNISSIKSIEDNRIIINCKDIYGHSFKTIISWYENKNEDIYDEFEESTSKYARFFSPEVNKYLQKRYSPKKIDVLDRYITDLLHGGLSLDELSSWNTTWIRNMMSEAERNN